MRMLDIGNARRRSRFSAATRPVIRTVTSAHGRYVEFLKGSLSRPKCPPPYFEGLYAGVNTPGMKTRDLHAIGSQSATIGCQNFRWLAFPETFKLKIVSDLAETQLSRSATSLCWIPWIPLVVSTILPSILTAIHN